MKKVLFGLVSIFLCNVALADAKVVNDITDKTKIYWEAVDAAVTVFNSEETRAIMYAFFVEREGKELSAKDILGYCRTMEKDLVQCANFVKKYVNYTGGDASNCTVVSNLMNTTMQTETGNVTVGDLKDLLGACHSWSAGGNDVTYKDGVKIAEDSRNIGGASWADACIRAIEHLKKCTRHLESYYTKELLKTDLDAKKQKQYSCMLNLVQTGQLELPMNLMEKRCK